MGYFPIDVINKLQVYGTLDQVVPLLIETIEEKTEKKIDVGDDLIDYVFSRDFFNENYKGKYKVLNDFLMYDREINHIVNNGIKFKDFHQRMTEWRDLFGECYVLKEWEKSKMVYKVDNDFFHEIKNTTNLKFSNDMLSHLPFNTMYFDLSDVKEIGAFAGAWVEIYNYAPKEYMSVIYMVTSDIYSVGDVNQHGLFSYYCAYDFSSLDMEDEVDIPIQEMLSNMQDDYILRDFKISFNGDIKITKMPLKKEEDYRRQIIAAVLQILQFLHAKIEDIDESPITKGTYKPSPVIKNKFSEVRMWDVGIRYGKAIRFAKKQVKEELAKAEQENKERNTSGKRRKPVRPHIRSAHWQRYHVGEGRKQIKVNWIPPIYVCGTKEIPVTIRKVGA